MEFPVDFLDVVPDSVDGDQELVSDQFVAQSVRDELDDLHFLFAERLGERRGRVEILYHLPRDRWGDRCVTIDNIVDAALDIIY